MQELGEQICMVFIYLYHNVFLFLLWEMVIKYDNKTVINIIPGCIHGTRPNYRIIHILIITEWVIRLLILFLVNRQLHELGRHWHWCTMACWFQKYKRFIPFNIISCDLSCIWVVRIDSCWKVMTTQHNLNNWTAESIWWSITNDS